MVKGIILDVDGVLVGEKIGYNSPYPHPDVLARLKAIKAKGILISLCTAKPYYAVQPIIEGASLRNLHITEGGAVIIDSIDDVILKTHLIDKTLAKQAVQIYLDAGVYVEAYALNEYLVDKSQVSGLTETHAHILQTEPRVVDSLPEAIDDLEICKVMPVAKNQADKPRLIELFEPFKDKLTLSWGVHRIALPHQFGIITAKGISKQQATLEVARYNRIKPEELLGIGDSTSDWQFMEQCGYAATLANGSDQLKQLVVTKKDRSYIGGSVDSNGVLSIFDYFGLLV
jgi:HAD superfamily hydrolase (TIGR01484 family)